MALGRLRQISAEANIKALSRCQQKNSHAEHVCPLCSQLSIYLSPPATLPTGWGARAAAGPRKQLRLLPLNQGVGALISALLPFKSLTRRGQEGPASPVSYGYYHLLHPHWPSCSASILVSCSQLEFILHTPSAHTELPSWRVGRSIRCLTHLFRLPQAAAFFSTTPPLFTQLHFCESETHRKDLTKCPDHKTRPWVHISQLRKTPPDIQFCANAKDLQIKSTRKRSR